MMKSLARRAVLKHLADAAPRRGRARKEFQAVFQRLEMMLPSLGGPLICVALRSAILRITFRLVRRIVQSFEGTLATQN